MAGGADFDITPTSGLRDRKKARRRDELIAGARELFARQGIDSTSMAEIAEAAEVSAPTVFNYFGSKDGILIAMIVEGTDDARETDRDLPPLEGVPLIDVIADLFSRIAIRTLDIAGKRVWRYAEAAVIRHPDTDLARSYKRVTRALVQAIQDHLSEYELVTRRGDLWPADEAAEVLHDLWMPCFIELITTDDMTVETHDTMLRHRLLPLLEMLMHDNTLSAPRLRQKTA